MKPALFALAKALVALAFGTTLPASHPLFARADAGAEAVAAEVPGVYGDLSAAEQERRGRVAMVFGFHEAAWLANPPGSNDKGGACGWGQVHLDAFPKGTFPAEMTCAAIRSDLRTSVRAHLIAMRYFEDKCGSLRAGLTAYATTGACPKAGYTIKLVARRCSEAGGC